MGAGLMKKMMGMLGVSQEEEIEDMDYIDEDVEEIEEKPVRSGYFSKNSLRSMEPVKQEREHSAKMLSIANTNVANKVVITQPVCFDEVTEIGEYIKQRKSVIINLEVASKADGARIIDFVSGSVFAMDGSLQKISTLIFLATPKTVEIQNDIERAEYRSKLSFSWLK